MKKKDNILYTFLNFCKKIFYIIFVNHEQKE